MSGSGHGEFKVSPGLRGECAVLVVHTLLEHNTTIQTDRELITYLPFGTQSSAKTEPLPKGVTCSGGTPTSIGGWAINRRYLRYAIASRVCGCA